MNTLAGVLSQSQQPNADTPDLTPLTNHLIERFGQSVLAVLLYGSCRQTKDLSEGLVDLCVIVDSYRSAQPKLFDRLTNQLLPPNVYFLQTASLRCKYIVISKTQFEKKLSSRWDHYFWARFSQPFTVLYTQTLLVKDDLVRAQQKAIMTFYRDLVSLEGLPSDALEFWAWGLRKTYACELRPEKPEHSIGLIRKESAFWQAITDALANEISLRRTNTTQALRHWRVRRITGKALNLARLIKAASTFQDGVDYIAWKVERHSGVTVEIKPWMRRHPRLAGWWLAWQLKRRGGFR